VSTDRLVQDIQARGNFGYTLAGLFGRRGRSRAPLAIASFIAIPLFFSTLMASTLALEKPRVVEWRSGDRLLRTFHDPAGATTAKVWLWALLPPLLLILAGWVATRLPYGFYVACGVAVVLAIGVVHKAGTWERHHTARFPNGVDLIPASNPASDKFDPGEWEKTARDTAVSLERWTIGLAVVCILAMAGLALRRRHVARRLPPQPGRVEPVPVESVHAPDATAPPAA
jgi:hypothetical protein